MRGKEEVTDGASQIVGITPAYAGKSAADSGNYRAEWDHPRVCGEKGFIGLEVGLYPGSPPRMRGKD